MTRALISTLVWLVCLSVLAPESWSGQERVVWARAGTVLHAEGGALYRPRNEKDLQTLHKGVKLENGDAVLTAEKGHTDWLLTPGSYLHVGSGSDVRVYETSFDQMHFDVERGEVLVVVRSLKDGASLIIHTPPGSLMVHQAGRYLFRVAENGETEAEVGKGELRYQDHQGKVVSLKKRMKVNFSRVEKKITHGP